MVIEVNKDIDRYQESVAMGLTARQLIFSIASVVVVAVSSFFFTSISVLRVLLMWQFHVWHRLLLADSIPLTG